jgi:hypothetical protein
MAREERKYHVISTNGYDVLKEEVLAYLRSVKPLLKIVLDLGDRVWMPGDEMFYGPGTIGFELGYDDGVDPRVHITFIDYR